MTREIVRTPGPQIEGANALASLEGLEGVPNGALLLAHHDDGVIWGIVQDAKIVTYAEIETDAAAQFRLDTLQQARIFWPDGEILVWRDSITQELSARRITDGNDADFGFVGFYDEAQILWGDRAQEAAKGWTRMTDGVEGLSHIVPVDFTVFRQRQGFRPLRLNVRNYLKKHDLTGAVYVALSRLVTLEVK